MTSPPSAANDLAMEYLPKFTASAFTLLQQSCRIEILGRRYHDQIMARNQPVLTSAWHFAFPALTCYFRNQGGLVMVSRSRDGEFAARTLQCLGYRTVRGSSHRGGSKALREMIALIRQGHSGGFVADGSQGPPEIAQKGILLLARYAKAPVMPLSAAAKPCFRLPGWDRTLLPLPFSRVVLAFGPPIWVPADTEAEGLEKKRELLQTELKDLTRRARAALARG